MNEPTIDEMLEFVDSAIWDVQPVLNIQSAIRHDEAAEMRLAIRAILEQHRPMERGKGLLLMHPNDIDRGKLEAIRAFVERVRAQREFADISYGKAIQDELAALEKEK